MANSPFLFSRARFSFLVVALSLVACGSERSAEQTTARSAPFTVVEKSLTVDLTLSTAVVDGGAGSDGGAVTTTTLTITARDGTTPIVTDLWLYTLDSQDQKVPLTDFTSTAARKSPRLMLPATLGGKPSGLSPADDGNENGLVTATSRGKLVGGVFTSTVDGSVDVTLAAAPTSAILVVAGVEDERYAGAAAILADGTARDVPAGVGVPASHAGVSYESDVAPILEKNCTTPCHNPSGPEGAAMYLLDSRDHLVNDNFALTEQTADCKAADSDGGPAYAACLAAITQAQFLVEPGAPAVSDLLQRARPDESLGTSPSGLLWYGGGKPKARYNAKYGDRRMPSTTISTESKDWQNASTAFDLNQKDYQVLYDWIAQGASP